MYRNIWNDIILMNLKDFENIGVGFYINIFTFCFAVCICIAAVFFEINRGQMNLVVKQLIRHGATDADNAKTLSDLGLNGKRIIRFQLSRRSRLSILVSRVGAPSITYEEYVKMPPAKRKELEVFDINTATFYIPDENKERANKILHTYAFSLPRIILFCMFILLIWALITVFSYEIFCLINNALGRI